MTVPVEVACYQIVSEKPAIFGPDTGVNPPWLAVMIEIANSNVAVAKLRRLVSGAGAEVPFAVS
jgi:hypothetical protein